MKIGYPVPILRPPPNLSTAMLRSLLSLLSVIFALCLIMSPGPSRAVDIIDEYSAGPGIGPADGLDDLWQALYNGWGLSLGGDEDFDGCTNQIECIAGSDPRNAKDCLMIGDMVIGGANIIMNFEARKGKEYQIWESDSPGGPLPGEPGSQWTPKAGAMKVAAADGADSIVFAKPSAAVRKFYRIETKDRDSDGDGVSDWAEAKVGTDIAPNASGGVAGDLETLKSLLSLKATAGVAEAFEKEGTHATIQLQRSYGTMPLTISLSGLPVAPGAGKSSASASDFIFKNMAGEVTETVTLPANEGTSNPYTVARVAAVADDQEEVPESLKVMVALPGAPEGIAVPEATVTLKDADPEVASNRTLYIAYLGREEGAATTASGYATALVNGDNTEASISVFFSNLSSEQNTAYIRYGLNNDLAPALPNGQVSGFSYSIAYKPGFLSSDQAFLDALKNGDLYCVVSSAEYPDREIFGKFNRATGTEQFDAARPDLQAPALGDTLWAAPTGDALEREIWRFMSQCTFGGTTALYNEIRAMCDASIASGGTYLDGLSAWLDKQMDPAQTPTVSFRQLLMAADTEEFMLRGNKPITYNSDPQIISGTYGVSFVNGMPMANTSLNTNAPGDNYPRDAPNRRREWWTKILQSKDQVRQRMAHALHQICVVSERDFTLLTYGYGLANYWDMLAAGAFGKYRTLLENVTLNPMMGIYLTSMANRAAYEASPGLVISPDENYAREIMQLFSIGLILRHPDGSLKLSSEGLPIPTYDNNDISELARVFTGFSHGARHGNATVQVNGGNGTLTNSTQRVSPTVYINGTANNTWFGRDNGHLYFQAPWLHPMKVIGRINSNSLIYHDFGAKSLLNGKHAGITLPAQTVTTGASPTPASDAAVHDMAYAEVKAAHDMLAGDAAAATYGNGTPGSPGHTNTPVNISRWLIQRLVTSNPSAGYIYRVQQVYRSTNGNLGQVLKAILLDYEARSLQLADSSISHGKVKEPLVHFASILRQFRAYSGASVNVLRDMQPPFSDTDGPMASGYPASEVDKFDTSNLNPPSKPASWPSGPFRFRLDSLRNSLGQSPQDAPTVFNWFYPDFQVPGKMSQAGLFAPELQIATEAGEVAKINHLYGYTWMTLAGMSSTPGVGVANFILNNSSATPAARFSINGGSSYLSFPATITLNETNWNTGVTVTMQAINNLQFSQMAGTSVRFSTSGSATGYSGLTVPPLPISLIENEVRNEQLVITQTSGGTWVREGNASTQVTDTFTVMLSMPPVAGTTVEVTLTSASGEVTLAPAVLTFDAANWNQPQVVTVTAVDDSDVEDGASGNDSITFATTSLGASFNGLVTPPLTVGVRDNAGEGYGVMIVESSGSTSVTETSSTAVSPLSAGMDSYSIVLTKAPTSNVVVTINANGQLGVNTTSTGTSFTTATTTRTFTAANWSTPQTVVVRGNNDTTSENYHNGSITHTITTASPEYPLTMPVQSLTVPITDDDNSIIVAHTGGETRVNEDGSVTDTITVRLRSNPNAEVSVMLGSGQLRFEPSVLAFKPTGSPDKLWNVDQTVVVTALNDHVDEGLHTGGVAVQSQSAGTNYNGSTGGTNLPVTIIDNDDTRVVVTQSDGATVVNEDGTVDTYILSLSRPPAAGTTVSVALSGFSGITVTPAGPFVFDETNWNTAQTITVGTAADGTAETTAVTNITHTVSSTDPAYNRTSTPVVTVTVLDNDPALTIAQTGIFTTVREGGTAGAGGTPNAQDTFTVVLPRAPASGTSVSVALSSSQVSVSPSVLNFTSATSGVGAYNIAQTVTVTANDDLDLEAAVHEGLINFSITSTDSYYNGAFAPPVVAYVTDNDSPGVSIVEGGGTTSVTEGSATADSYTVTLTKQPTSNVDIVVSGGTQNVVSKTTSGHAASVTLNFTPSNWAVAQTVSVLPVNDTLAENRHLAPITHSVTAGSALEYRSLVIPPVISIITDNDTTVAGNKVRITESSSSTGVTESGATVNGISSNSDTFTVVLDQQPTAPVTVTFTADAQLAVTPSVLTFVPGASGAGTFNVAQTVTVRAVDDAVMESILHWGQITASVSSADTSFNGVQVAPVTSSIYDNDGARVIVTPSDGATVLREGGATDTYSLALSREPLADVTVSLVPDAQVSSATSSVTFTPANWNQPQTIVISAVDDEAVETISHAGILAHTVSSADPAFQGVSAPSVIATIWDSDSPGLNVTHAGADTSATTLFEGGATDAFVVKLNTAPAPGTSVTITLHPPTYYIPVPQHGKAVGYFNNDFGGSNERDNIVIDYTESILKYREVFYGTLAAAYAPAAVPASPSAVFVQNAHWAASKAVVDQMDLWFMNGSLKARNPVLVEPNKPLPNPLPAFNPRQAIMDAIYRHAGGDNSPSTTRYSAASVFNPQNPRGGNTLDNEICDRVRWCGYLMTIGTPSFVSH